MVQVYDRRRLVSILCLQPVISLPPEDVVVMHLLMILANEAEYLETANQFWFALPTDVATEEPFGGVGCAVLNAFSGSGSGDESASQ